MTFADELRALNACREAVLWVGDRTLEQAWRECKRSDWMLWLLRELRIDARRCAGLFALRVWHLVPKDAELAAAWESQRAKFNNLVAARFSELAP